MWYTLIMSTTKRKETRTYKDRALYMREAVKRRRKKLRTMALEYGGGKCKICGYKKCGRALSFHHRDPKKKDFGIAYGGITRSWEKTRKELDKCILLCANCHMEVHENLAQLPPETKG
jgi:5-methylcytosine-specific restriction endonuclease McrA